MSSEVFTTGDVAKMFKVAPRTCSKWFDSGKLKGYRIPGSLDRRIPKENLIQFARENGMPLSFVKDIEPSAILISHSVQLRSELALLLGSDIDFVAAPTWFDAGLNAMELRPKVVVMDCNCGRHECLIAARAIRSAADRDGKPIFRGCKLVALCCADECNQRYLEDAGFCKAFMQPIDLAEVANAVRGLLS